MGEGQTPFVKKERQLTLVELAEYRELTQQHPLGMYYNTLATAEYRMGNHKEAIVAALQLTELTPKEMNLARSTSRRLRDSCDEPFQTWRNGKGQRVP